MWRGPNTLGSELQLRPTAPRESNWARRKEGRPAQQLPADHIPSSPQLGAGESGLWALVKTLCRKRKRG